MAVTGLDLLFLEVNNLEESLGFYRDLLGLDLEKSNPDGEPPMATVRAGNMRITLAEQPETMLRRGRGAHFFLGVTDVDEYYQQLKARGDDLGDVQPPADEGWGGRFITLQDPDKYRFFFCYLVQRAVTRPGGRSRLRDAREPFSQYASANYRAVTDREGGLAWKDNTLKTCLGASKGQLVTIKTITEGIYEGRIEEITNDYVCLVERKNDDPTQVFVFFSSLESMMLVEVPLT